ncbi:serine protease [Tychonema sp. BBK16]|uniref:S1 family peptidase n=1 Tax=Tychonema sp. BBK16 TaxID=2699888 RepID=UPI001F40624B|nr:serine protease [Tychonema sp. BBK16]MCF6375561.1 serine protease [Tychonema sp. BBK16]
MSYSALASIVFAVGRTGANGVQLLGTATLLNIRGKFVTAAHVTNKDEQNLVVVIKPNHLIVNDYQDTSDSQVQIIAVRIEAIDPFTDLCILSADIADFSNISMGSTDLLSFGSVVDIFGYPHADHGRLVLTHQRTEIGAKILIKNGIVKTKQVVLNTQARPGQSGSPIFSAYTTTVVAILIGSYAPGGGGGISLGGVDPHTLHQTTHAVSVEYVKEML